MFLFSLLAKAVDKLEQSKDRMLEQRFAQRGCSKFDMMAKIQEAQVRGLEAERRMHERTRRFQEARQATQGQRCS